MALSDDEPLLTIQELKALGKARHRSLLGPSDHAFWAGPMPDPNNRPECHQSIQKVYDEFLDPPLTYVDAYHKMMGGSPVFNRTIQDVLINNAVYMVVDLSVPRHDVLFEAGFGLATGMQTIVYFDARSSLRSQYPKEAPRFKGLKELKRELPSEMADALLAQPPMEIPQWGPGARAPFERLAQWINESIHSPGQAIRRRECCKSHLENKKCEFTKQLRKLRGLGQVYFYASFQIGHEDQRDFVMNALRRRGYVPVEEIPEIADSDHSLCRACLSSRLADRIVADGTSSDLYDKSCAESAFILGMAAGMTRKRPGDAVKVKMLYDEKVGPIGMFAGGRASWQGEKWRDHVTRELEDW